jgi:RNA polymerase sigma-70 factor (ECF subfamily)
MWTGGEYGPAILDPEAAGPQVVAASPVWLHRSNRRNGIADTMATAAEELTLIARILSGERDLFHDLIRPYERLVYLTALSVLKSDAEAEDISQESIIKAFRALARFRGEAKFSTWLVSIVLNEARGRLRKTGRVLLESLDETAQEGEDFTPVLLADWREIPSEALERQELASAIERAVEDLPVIYREVFVLRDQEQLSIGEIAQALGVSTGLAKVRLHRARMMLQKRLAPFLKQALSPSKSWWHAMGGQH